MHLGRREGWRALLIAVSVDLSSIRRSLKQKWTEFENNDDTTVLLI